MFVPPCRLCFLPPPCHGETGAGTSGQSRAKVAALKYVEASEGRPGANMLEVNGKGEGLLFVRLVYSVARRGISVERVL